jgi:hypothetical protein
MGLISSAATVNVQAFLTKKGKKILHQNAGAPSGPLITKFSIGDSDAEYNSIVAGYGQLAAGAVPEAAEYQPAIRGFALAEGSYRPGTPLVIINDQAVQEHSIEMLINGSEPSILTFNIRTEWPSNTPYEEEYFIEIDPPYEMSEETFSLLFNIRVLTADDGSDYLAIVYNENGTALNLTGARILAQASTVGFSVVVIGKDTNASTTIFVDVRTT